MYRNQTARRLYETTSCLKRKPLSIVLPFSRVIKSPAVAELGKNSNLLGKNSNLWTIHSSIIRSKTTSSSSLSSFAALDKCNQIPQSQTKSLSSISNYDIEHVEFKPSKVSKVQEKTPNFDNPEAAHGNKSITELLRSLIVFQLCKLPFIVQNADQLIDFSNKILGVTVTDSIVRNVFFKQFCAGENEHDILPTLNKLKKCNVGAILDFAAEDDANESKPTTNSSSSSVSSVSHPYAQAQSQSQADGHDIVAHPPFNQPARIYKYQSEQNCDHHVDIFLKCIRAVKQNCSLQERENLESDTTSSSPAITTGFAAIKVTALGNPLLLERMSIAINEAKNLFVKFDQDMDGFLSRQEFQSAYELFFNDANEKLPALFDELDPNDSNCIDYITFMSKLMSPTNLPNVCASCKSIGPLSLATLSKEELDLLSAMHDRAHTLAKEASACGVRLLIDAEQTRYQPAIDNLALELQQTYNGKRKTDSPIIFNTYQCYLKDTVQRIEIDLKRSIKLNYHFGAKLVRGAYMVSERSRAKELNLPSPIHPTIGETHDCYNNIIDMLLRKKVEDSKLESLEIMCATHNQESIEKALELMAELNLNEKSSSNSIHFAQLYGMSDNLTFPLGAHKYSSFKYVPYGQLQEVMPYLLRRAQENSDFLGNASKETSLLLGALKNKI